MTINLPTDIKARPQHEQRLRELLQAAVVQVENGETLDVDEAFDEVEMELFDQRLSRTLGKISDE